MTETTPSSRPTKTQAVPNLAKLAEAERKERKSDLPASMRVKESTSTDDPLDGLPFTD